MNTPILRVMQVAFGIAILVLWQIASTVPIRSDGQTLIDPFFFSAPLKIFERLWVDFSGGVIWYHLWITFIETILAFLIGSVLGILIGLWLARRALLAAVLDPYIKIGNALPRVVFAPIFALYFGLGIWSKVALGVTLVFFIVFFSVYQGVRDADRGVLANARMLGMNERALLRHVYIPSALTWMFSSLHTSVGFALIGAVIGEYLGAAAGLGYRISQAEGAFDVTGVFAGTFVLICFVVVIDGAITLSERRLLSWRPQALADATYR